MIRRYDAKDHARFTAIARVLAKHGIPSAECLAELQKQAELGMRPWDLGRLVDEISTPLFHQWREDFEAVVAVSGQMHAFLFFGQLAKQSDESQMRAALGVVRAKLQKTAAQRRAKERVDNERKLSEERQALRDRLKGPVLAPDGRRVGDVDPNEETASELAMLLELNTPKKD